MATGGGNDREGEDNPFSFKKFVETTSRIKTKSDANWENTCEEVSPEISESKTKKPDENPFSFKRFLQTGEEHKQQMVYSNDSGRLATLDLANDLPDFVQDHYNSDRELSKSRTKISASEVRLPDFALDSANAKSHKNDCHPDIYDSADDALCEECLDINPTVSGNENLVKGVSVDRHDRLTGAKKLELGFKMHSAFATNDWHSVSNMANHGDKREGLPDFLSDSGLAATLLSSVSAATDKVPSRVDNLVPLITDGDRNTIYRLQEENQDLRRQLKESREFAYKESARAVELLKDMETLRKHEADETAALEKMVQQVEANLQTTLERAVNAEKVIVKLKQEIVGLQRHTNSLMAENELLRSTNYNPLQEKTLFASKQIVTAATDAEELLKQLLCGVDKLKMISNILASANQVFDVPTEELKEVNSQ